MPFVRIWIHTVWATKKREPLLDKTFRPNLFNHIRENAELKGIYLDHIGGFEDHVHCLISLKSHQCIKDVMQLIKGESSFWTNRKYKKLKRKLNWQDEYFAVSVSQSHVDSVRRYIKNQEEHHRKKSFQEEYNEFINKYGFKLYKD